MRTPDPTERDPRERWLPALPATAPPPRARRSPRCLARCGFRLVLIGVSLSAVTSLARQAGGTWQAVRQPASGNVEATRLVRVADTDGRRYWGLPPNDFVRVPLTRSDPEPAEGR